MGNDHTLGHLERLYAKISHYLRSRKNKTHCEKVSALCQIEQEDRL